MLGNLPTPVASLAGRGRLANADWYDYSSKYDEGGWSSSCRRRASTDAQIERARELAVAAFVATSARAWRAPTSSSAPPTARS